MTSSNVNPKGIDDAIVAGLAITAAPSENFFPESEWGEPTPLLELMEVTPLDLDLVPDAWRNWLIDNSSRIGCPNELLFINALSALSILIGRLFTVQPKERDSGWKANLTQLWTIVLASSGSKKSPARSAAFAPLDEFERKMFKEFLEATKRNAPEIKRLKELERELLKQSTKGSDASEIEAELAQIHETLRNLETSQHRLMTQEPTIQAICTILRSNHLGIAIVLDELTSFFLSLDKDNRQSDRQFYLTGWNANSPYTSDTVSRGTTRVEHLAITVSGSIQPAIFKKYCHDLIRNRREGDGLLARFQLLALAAGRSGKGADTEPDKAAQAVYAKCFRAIGDLRLRRSEEGPNYAQVVFRFSPEAQLLFNEYLDCLEDEILESEGDELYHDYLAKQRSTMPLVALLMEVIEISSSGSDQVVCARLEGEAIISLDSTQRAAAICDWMKNTAKSLYSGDNDSAHYCAHQLLKRGATVRIDGLTESDILKKKWSGICDKEILNQALDVLCDHNYIRKISIVTRGRPRQEIKVNPNCRELLRSEVPDGK